MFSITFSNQFILPLKSFILDVSWFIYPMPKHNFWDSIFNTSNPILTALVSFKVKYSNFYYTNDIALLKLNQPLPSTVSSLCLPEESVKDSQTCVISGWKKIIPGGITIMTKNCIRKLINSFIFQTQLKSNILIT